MLLLYNSSKDISESGITLKSMDPSPSLANMILAIILFTSFEPCQIFERAGPRTAQLMCQDWLRLDRPETEDNETL